MSMVFVNVSMSLVRNLSRFLFTSVTHFFFITSKFLSVIAMLVRYVKISLKVKVAEYKSRRTSSVKLVHLRGILTSKAKVLYCSLRLNTYSKFHLLFRTCLESSMSLPEADTGLLHRLG